MHMIKCKYFVWGCSLISIRINQDVNLYLDEKNPKLVDIYKQKMGEYLERAEYLKKTVIKKDDEPIIAQNAGGSAAKKK